MEQELRVEANDREFVITCVNHPDWTDMNDPCPDCGATEFRHFATEGGRYGQADDAVVLRADYWDATKPLFTQCLECKAVLHKHPAFDLVFATPKSDSDGPLEC